MFSEQSFDYWIKRPIEKEFLLYSALDVKYQYNTYVNLKNDLKKILINFYEINNITDNNIELLILLISCSNHNEVCDLFMKRKKELN